MSATAPFDALLMGNTIGMLVNTASDANLFAGNLGAIDATGKGVIASDTAGLKVIGRIEEDVKNGDNVYRGGARTVMAQGRFRYKNSTAHPLTAADIGSMAYVEDCETVAKSSTNSIKAGIVTRIGGEDASGSYDPTQPFVFVDTARAI